MSAIFSVLILAMRTETVGSLVNVVREVDCSLTATQAGQTAQMNITAPLGNADVSDFVPYASLTQSKVLGWVDVVIDAQASKPFMQQMLDYMIASASFGRPALPWA